jgi:hypothetical protein
MNVRQLKEQLAGVPDEALVVVPGPDHSYRPALVDSTKALLFYEGRSIVIGEDSDQEDGKPVRVDVLVFSPSGKIK